MQINVECTYTTSRICARLAKLAISVVSFFARVAFRILQHAAARKMQIYAYYLLKVQPLCILFARQNLMYAVPFLFRIAVPPRITLLPRFFASAVMKLGYVRLQFPAISILCRSSRYDRRSGTRENLDERKGERHFPRVNNFIRLNLRARDSSRHLTTI